MHQAVTSGLDLSGGHCPRPLKFSWLVSGTKECLPNPSPQSLNCPQRNKNTHTPNPINHLHRKPEAAGPGKEGSVLMLVLSPSKY